MNQKLEARQGSGSTISEGPKLGPGSSLTFKARARPWLDPSLLMWIYLCTQMSIKGKLDQSDELLMDVRSKQQFIITVFVCYYSKVNA